MGQSKSAPWGSNSIQRQQQGFFRLTVFAQDHEVVGVGDDPSRPNLPHQDTGQVGRLACAGSATA